MNENTYLEEDEITLKELILKLQEFWKELLRNWLLIGIITLPLVAWFFYNAYTTPVEYKSDLVFMINEEKGGGSGGLSAIAGQFGFNVGGGGGEYNKEKIVSLSKTGKIIHAVITDSIEIGGVKDILGNHLIDIYNLDELWEDSENEKQRNYRFKTDEIEKFGIEGNIALKTCFSLIVAGNDDFEPLSTCSYNEESGILSISSKCISDELSLALTNRIYENLSSFYITQKTEPQQKSFLAIKAKADSLNTLIKSKEYELATLKDGNNNIFLRKYKLREDRLQRELPAYASQYATLLQNVENADFILKSSTPFFQVIDYPFYPLNVINASKLKALLLGGGLGLFLSAFFIVGRKVVRDVMD